MPRIMTIWLPRWPAQRRIGENPTLRAVPVFVCRRGRGGTMTIVSWAWAQPPRRAPALAGGRSPPRIPSGMSLAEGMAVLALAHGSRACRAAEVVHDDPEADRGALEELARRCRRFAPIVGLEEAERPECVHVDVTGTASFFGGDEPLARTAVWMLAARGLHGRAAVADTAGAAWAAAHHAERLDRQPPVPWRRRRRFAVVPPGRQAAALAALPAGALRIEEGPVALLREVGIDSIGGVLKLPRRGLAARFPPVLALRLAQFLGTRAEPIVPASGEMPPQAAHAFDAPTSLRDVDEAQLGGILERLVERCVAPLAARGEGVTSLQVRFESRMARGDGHAHRPPLVIDVGLYRPTVSVRHVVDLVRLRMSRMRPPHEVEGIVAEVVAASPTVCRQRTLFSGPSESIVAEVGMLFDRLAGRLGSGAVFEPRMVRDAQPEHAWAPVPPAVPHERIPPSPVRVPSRRGPAGRRPPAPPIVPAVPAERRPIWLLPRPLPLEVLAMVPAVADAGRPPARFRYGGECHDVAEAYGPERIETAWWRGPTVRRDYYVVETASGGRFWLFRRLREGDWFLHGLFG